jgi:hypothetical protein
MQNGHIKHQTKIKMHRIFQEHKKATILNCLDAYKYPSTIKIHVASLIEVHFSTK